MIIQQKVLAKVLGIPEETASLWFCNFRFSKFYKKVPFKVGRRTIKKPCFEFCDEFITELIDYFETRRKIRERNKLVNFVKVFKKNPQCITADNIN